MKLSVVPRVVGPALEAHDSGDVLRMIRAKLDADLLPRQLSRPPVRARGSDVACSACAFTIDRSEVRYDLEAHGGPRDGGSAYSLHVGCFAGWVVECRLQGWRGWRSRRPA